MQLSWLSVFVFFVAFFIAVGGEADLDNVLSEDLVKRQGADATAYVTAAPPPAVTAVQVQTAAVPVTTTAPPPAPAGETAPAASSSGTKPNNNNSGSTSGLSSSNKKIIIGVVVGVGGAIVLGAVAFVMWRVAGKRHNTHGDEDDLMSGTALGATAREKTPSPRYSAPFQHSLDQYHHPAPVNAASNF